MRQSLCEKWIVVSLLSILPLTIFSNPQHSVISRYITVENKPKSEQVNLLSQVIQVRFSQKIQTIGDALQHILSYSGYSLVDSSRQCPELKATLTKPLPFVDRQFGPMSLQDALTTLAGPAFTLAHAPLNREINFTVKPAYKPYGKPHGKS